MSKTDPKNNAEPIVPNTGARIPRRRFLKQGSVALASLGLAYRPAEALPDGTPVPGGVVDASTTIPQASASSSASASGASAPATSAAKGVASSAALKGYNILFVLVDQDVIWAMAGLFHCQRMSD